MEQTSGIKAWQWVVTIIVIIALIVIGILVFGNNKSADDSMMTDDTVASDSMMSGETNRVVMGDQFPGNQVFVTTVQLANGGWVAIHKDNGGVPGEIIGTMYFEKGINTGKITLTKPTVEGGLYYAMLHSDDGDKKFDTAKDLPLKDSKGDIIMKPFRASASVGAGLKG